VPGDSGATEAFPAHPIAVGQAGLTSFYPSVLQNASGDFVQSSQVSSSVRSENSTRSKSWSFVHTGSFCRRI
jgi:hypothetical protein